jgi:hypothetical protein
MQLHVEYLRGLEDSRRVDEACLAYLQTWLMVFYPDRKDIIEHARRLAEKLGGQLSAPSFGWKYSWIKAIFGWNAAKRAQLFLPSVRWMMARHFDRLLLCCNNRVAGAGLDAIMSSQTHANNGHPFDRA